MVTIGKGTETHRVWAVPLLLPPAVQSPTGEKGAKEGAVRMEKRNPAVVVAVKESGEYRKVSGKFSSWFVGISVFFEFH